MRGLPRARHAGEHSAPGINGGVDLGRPPAPGASQGMITRLTVHRPGAVAAGDRGVQYRSIRYGAALAEADADVSVGSKGGLLSALPWPRR